MSDETLMLAERSVPRYTSYPTAPHFSPAVGARTYADWLDRLPRDAALSLYIHVPFCRELCLYCGCHTKAVRRQEPIDAFGLALKSEIALVGERLKRQAVSHMHWGGGTPSLLPLGQMLAIVEEAARVLDIGALREHAIELDPRYITSALAAGLARLGINRASLGVQELSPQVQRAIRRVQSYDTIARAVDDLRNAGIGHINVDLMYGLPGQTCGDVCATVERICALAPRRIALFGYAHVPWIKRHQRLIDADRLPGAAARLAQMNAARALLLSLGYEAVGFDHFAVPDDALAVASRRRALHRNFQGYTTDDADALIGLGASAIGRLPNGFVQNTPDIGAYSRAVCGGQFATARGIATTPDDRMRARIIERIMCDFAIDLREASTSLSDPALAAELAALQPLAADGIVEMTDTAIRVTERGRPFVRLVAAVFDCYLARGAAGHSRAV